MRSSHAPIPCSRIRWDRLALSTAGLLAVWAGEFQARADIMGFNNLTGWTSNRADAGPPASMINPGTLQITNGTPQVRSVYYNTAQDISAFTATFRLRAVSIEPISIAGQGVCLVLHRAPGGLSAIGMGNGGLGLAGLSPARGLAIYSVGETRSSWGIAPGNETGNAQLESLRPLDVSVSYAGATLVVTIDDPTLPGVEYTATHNVGSLVTQLGAPTAIIGFTASTGTTTNLGGATFQISDFTYSTVPNPATVWAMVIVGGWASRRRRAWPAWLRGRRRDA